MTPRKQPTSRAERRLARQRSNAAKKGWATRRAQAASATPTARSSAAAARSAAARKGWDTRRERLRAEAERRIEEARERSRLYAGEYEDYLEPEWEIEVGIDYEG